VETTHERLDADGGMIARPRGRLLLGQHDAPEGSDRSRVRLLQGEIRRTAR
jgi:hypothetical protein